jgi:hypothetical protein
MTNPVVTVIEGPGDAVAEQARWSSLEASLLKGREMELGDQTWWSLEAVP